MKRFKAPKKSLGRLDADGIAAVIAATADVALLVDREGIIRDISFGSEELAVELDQRWIGQRWLDVVTVESRPKVEAMLREPSTKAAPRWRQVNHPLGAGQPDLPIVYSAVSVGRGGRICALGRDLRVVAALQQRLVRTEQSVERDYSRLRLAETRYRLLFQLSAEAVIVVDAATQKISAANPAAVELLGGESRRLPGRVFPSGFDAAGTEAIQVMLAAVRIAGRADEVRVELADDSRELIASATIFRQDNASYFLIQLAALEPARERTVVPRSRSKILEVIESSPDGLVVTDVEGRIIMANRAFLDLAELATEEQAKGAALERWLGRPGADLGLLAGSLRQHGSVRLFATSLRGEHGASIDVEISAVSVLEGEQPVYGYSVRNVGRSPRMLMRQSPNLPCTVDQLTALVGRVALRDLVRDATGVIERLCIETALDLSGDNRASTAEILGLSRQSLYVKLRRYGLGDLADPEPAGEAS